MKGYKKKIAAYKRLVQEEYVNEASVGKVVEQCQNVLPGQENVRSSYFEFLYEQSKFIQKKWWGLQVCVLVFLWLLLKDSGDAEYIEQIIGILATAFAILIMPEIWKNRRFSAVEIEGSSFYSLRQVYAARTVLFAVVDLLMVTVFFLVTIHTVQISAYRIIVNFLIPFNVSACICFRLLYSKWGELEYAAVLGSAVWLAIWSAIVSCNLVYHIIVEPIWLGLVWLSFGYLIFCIQKSQCRCEIIWEENADGIKA